MTEKPIGWTVSFKIQPGKANTFRKTVEEAVAAMKEAEPWHPVFQWFLSGDERSATVHVWCGGQAKAIQHITGIGPQKYLPRLLELAAIERFEVFGTPDAELAKILEAFPVTGQNAHLAGWTR